MSSVPANPVSTCIGCSQTDDHPKEHIDIGGVDVHWHMDCHLAVTGCDVCRQRLSGAEGKTGDELRKYLMSKKG